MNIELESLKLNLQKSSFIVNDFQTNGKIFGTTMYGFKGLFWEDCMEYMEYLKPWCTVQSQGPLLGKDWCIYMEDGFTVA